MHGKCHNMHGAHGTSNLRGRMTHELLAYREFTSFPLIDLVEVRPWPDS